MTTENQEKWLKVIREMVRRHRLSSTPSERKGIAVDIAEQALWLLELVDQQDIALQAALREIGYLHESMRVLEHPCGCCLERGCVPSLEQKEFDELSSLHCRCGVASE